MSPPFELRSATLADASGMARVKVDGWRAAYGELLPRAFLDSLSVEGERAQWESGMGHYPATFRVAVQQERVVGYVVSGPAAESSDPGEGELFALYVSPDRWGGGIGRRLMDQGLADLREAGFATAVLWVFDQNHRTRAFYERYGFTLCQGSRTELGEPVVKYGLRLK
ncbi:MAG: GNAT family N-acetyltransferase [Myxococcota bacterium]|nr:GNAT family N-acetyltransferase [Myxococcota bacterium]